MNPPAPSAKTICNCITRDPLNKYQIQQTRPSGAKARVDYADVSGTAEAVPFQNIGTLRN